MARRKDSGRSAFWQKLIEERRRSGLSVSRVCEQAGVSPVSYYQWQRKLREASPTRGAAVAPGAGRLVPVHIVPDAIGRREPAGVLEVELPGGIRLRIPAGFDRATLKLVVQLLRRGGVLEAV